MSKTSGFVWLNSLGEYMRVSERTTHTGHHIDVTYVRDINQASVLPILDRKLLSQHPEVKGLIQVAATCEVIRTVRLETNGTS